VFLVLRVTPEEYTLKKDTPENPGCLKNQLIQALASDLVDDHECRSTTVAIVTSCRDGENTTSGEAIASFNISRNGESTIAVCNSVTQKEVGTSNHGGDGNAFVSCEATTDNGDRC
jgi:hypothetical protein